MPGKDKIAEGVGSPEGWRGDLEGEGRGWEGRGGGQFTHWLRDWSIIKLQTSIHSRSLFAQDFTLYVWMHVWQYVHSDVRRDVLYCFSYCQLLTKPPQNRIFPHPAPLPFPLPPSLSPPLPLQWRDGFNGRH